MLHGQVFGSFEHFAGAFVGITHLALLVIGHGHDAQGKNFVDLRPVEQVARTFRRNLRVIVKNDGRGKHGVALAFGSDQNRPGSDILAARGELLQILGRLKQRYELAIGHPQQDVSGDQRPHQSRDRG